MNCATARPARRLPPGRLSPSHNRASSRANGDLWLHSLLVRATWCCSYVNKGAFATPKSQLLTDLNYAENTRARIDSAPLLAPLSPGAQRTPKFAKQINGRNYDSAAHLVGFLKFDDKILRLPPLGLGQCYLRVGTSVSLKGAQKSRFFAHGFQAVAFRDGIETKLMGRCERASTCLWKRSPCARR